MRCASTSAPPSRTATRAAPRPLLHRDRPRRCSEVLAALPRPRRSPVCATASCARCSASAGCLSDAHGARPRRARRSLRPGALRARRRDGGHGRRERRRSSAPTSSSASRFEKARCARRDARAASSRRLLPRSSGRSPSVARPARADRLEEAWKRGTDAYLRWRSMTPPSRPHEELDRPRTSSRPISSTSATPISRRARSARSGPSSARPPSPPRRRRHPLQPRAVAQAGDAPGSGQDRGRGSRPRLDPRRDVAVALDGDVDLPRSAPRPLRGALRAPPRRLSDARPAARRERRPSSPA